jgi:hypothetical protein
MNPVFALMVEMDEAETCPLTFKVFKGYSKKAAAQDSQA